MKIKLGEQIREEEKNTYEVQSSTEPNWVWIVKKTEKGWVCDCPGFTFHRKSCKHIAYIIAQIKNLKELDAKTNR